MLQYTYHVQQQVAFQLSCMQMVHDTLAASMRRGSIAAVITLS